jgi:hypothetical protein
MKHSFVSVVHEYSVVVDSALEQRPGPSLSSTPIQMKAEAVMKTQVILPMVVKSSYRRISSNSLSSNWASVGGGGTERD